tara:strand:+ start:43 stop:663 length:621 start_codon:yes stop_codon:yes gene_type:complete
MKKFKNIYSIKPGTYIKIAITGHKHGIGKAFAEQLAKRGHKIVGISRSDGENIRRTDHTASIIEPCELFINNANSYYAQTELLYAVWKRWQGQKKYIWNISTMMTEQPVNSIPDGLNAITGEAFDDLDMSQYRVQKLALEESSKQLTHKNSRPLISIIRPGGVNTQGHGGENVDTWVKSVIDTFTQHDNIHISEISIGHITKRIPI